MRIPTKFNGLHRHLQRDKMDIVYNIYIDNKNPRKAKILYIVLTSVEVRGQAEKRGNTDTTVVDM